VDLLVRGVEPHAGQKAKILMKKATGLTWRENTATKSFDSPSKVLSSQNRVSLRTSSRLMIFVLFESFLVMLGTPPFFQPNRCAITSFVQKARSFEALVCAGFEFYVH
jgi:hypothetical protein